MRSLLARRRPAAGPAGAARAARGSAAFTAAAFIQRGIGFLMLPIYTRALPPAEFGQLAVVLMVSAAIGTLVSFGLETAVFRAWFQLAPDVQQRRRFVNTVGLFLLVAPLAVTLLAALTVITPLADAFAVPADAMVLGILGVAVKTIATSLPMVLLRAQERLRAYLALTALSVGADTILMVGLVVIFDAGVHGWLLATFLSSVLLLVAGLVLEGHRWSTAFDWRHLRNALAFGLPLLPHAFSHWALSLSDRAILGAYVAPAHVGIYNLAYQLGLPVTVLAVALHQGVMPLYGQASIDDRQRQALAAVVTNQVFITGFLGLGAALLGPPVILLVMPPDYAAAADVIPWIALGLTFFGLYLIPVDAIAVMAGRTRWIWVATALAAATNVTLNLLLVPRFGVYAAAVNTAAGYAVLLAAVYVLMVRTVRPGISYEWARIGLGAAVATATAAFAMMAGPPETNAAMQFVIRAVALVVALAVLWRIAVSHRSSTAVGRTIHDATP